MMMARDPLKKLFLLLFIIVQLDFFVRVVEGRFQHVKPHHKHSKRQLFDWMSAFFPGFSFGGRNRNPAPTPEPQPVAQPTASASSTIADVPVSVTSAAPPAPSPIASSISFVQTTSTSAAVSSPSSQVTLPSVTQILTSSVAASQTVTSAKSSATHTAATTCSKLRVRKEWRKFSRQEQIDYINAVKCLANNPSKLLPGGNYRRYDDFQNVHSRMRNKIHWIASFLPWHRQFMYLFEKTLREECNYAGNLPRWDWTLDSGNMSKSPIWSSDSETGFGGNGRDFTDNTDGLDAGVVQDGAFANWPLFYPDKHLLQRNYNLPTQYKQAGKSWGSQYFDTKAIASVQSQKSYADFAVALEGTDPASTGASNPGPHSIIHVIIGGDISPTAYAANEPLFYLHHTNVDYHWWKWQNSQRAIRLSAYGGQRTRGSGRNDAKLTDQLNFLGLADDLTVNSTMDTSSYPYCYQYE